MSTNRNERLQEVSAPGTPTSATVVLYAKSDGLLYWQVASALYTATGAVKVSAG